MVVATVPVGVSPVGVAITLQRAPPQGLFEFDQTGGFDPTDPEAIPEFEFDQSLPD